MFSQLARDVLGKAGDRDIRTRKLACYLSPGTYELSTVWLALATSVSESVSILCLSVQNALAAVREFLRYFFRFSSVLYNEPS